VYRHCGLRHRALIGMMVYTFACIWAVLKMQTGMSLAIV
jgi:hypothetical protein